MSKPLRPRERTSSVNFPPPTTLVFSIGILSLLHALLRSTHSQFSILNALLYDITFNEFYYLLIDEHYFKFASTPSLVHYVFNPALVGGSLADTITFEDFVTLVDFGMDPSQNHKGSQKPRKFDNWCVFCRHRNLGNLPIIIIPAICKDKGNPFGDPDVCYIGTVYIWSYVYNIMRVSASKFHRESTASIHSIHSIHAY
ncbi:hypothetical protein HN873_031594, partial [Arachis hypogaea]